MFNPVKFIATITLLFTGIFSANAQWSTVGNAGITNAVANYTEMAVDNNNVPYIAFADNANGDKLSVRKWNGSSWSSIGTAISNSSIQYVSMAIDQNNNDIYVAYKDWSQGGKLSVKKYNGSSWSSLGTGITSSSVDYVSAVAYNGTVVVAYKDNKQGGKATCAYYYNGSWYALGNAGFTSGSVSYVNLAVTPNGYGYIGYRDHNNKPALYEWTQNGWSYKGTASSSGCAEVTMAVDTNDVPYLGYIDWSNSSKLTVRKYTSSWSTVGGTGITPNGLGSPDMAFDRNSNKPYVVYRDNNNNQKASVMSFDGSNWSNVGSAGFSANTVDYTSIAVDGTGALYVGFKDNAVGQKATVMKYSGGGGGSFNGITWDGSTSSNWGTASNWSGNSVPGSNDQVLIPNGLNRYPNITSNQYMYCNDLTIQNGASLTINSSGAYLLAYGDITNSGSFSINSGGVIFTGSSDQEITSSNNLDIANLWMYNNNNTLTLNDTVNITESCYVIYGDIATSDKLVLKSTSSGTARIHGPSSGNYITGKVTVEQYIPGGRRAFRFFSHPFSSAIKLSQLTDDIDITGQGGTSNGFTQVQVNAPSAFWFDPSTADNSTTGTNPGWKDFTSANTASWGKYEMARILFRGSKGQGLVQGNYTPNAVTLDMTGNINQGNETVSITKGSNSNFIIVGNPYPCAVNLKDVSRSNVGSNFCVWDPNQGTWGGYTSHQFSSNYYLPAYSAFVATVWGGNTASFYFKENDKTTGTPASLFKGDSLILNNQYIVELSIEDNTLFWDRLLIEFDSSANAKQDDNDMLKFYNPDLDFYTLMDDSTRISIDQRPYEYGKIIPLGIAAYETHRLAIRAPQFRVPAGATLYLYDKLLNKSEEIKEGFEYWFDVDPAIPATFGNDRFSISMGKAVSVENINDAVQSQFYLSPNPATTAVNIVTAELDKDAMIIIRDITGKVVYNNILPAHTGKTSLPLINLQSGMYIVELKNENIQITRKLIKH